MENGNVRRIALEDGCVFEVQAVRIPGWSFSSTALIVNDPIRSTADALLPSALALVKSRTTRLSFFRASRQSLDIESISFSQAEDAIKQASDWAEALSMLPVGLATDDKRTVSVGDWIEILQFFKKDSRVGSVEQLQE